MSAIRWTAFFLGAAVVAGAVTAWVTGCKSGDYDGSYDGGYDTGLVGDGSVTSRVAQPNIVETVPSSDGAFDVTFGAGTFTAPTTVSVTIAGERQLESGLVVPIYAVSAEKDPAKPFQVSFRGTNNNQGSNTGVLVPALQKSGSFEPLAIAGSPNINGGGSQVQVWGLSKALGTFSLVFVPSGLATAIVDTVTSCTWKCCGENKGGQVGAHPRGCLCSTVGDLSCFAECGDIDAIAARCAAIAASARSITVDCRMAGNNPPTGGSGPCGATGGGGGGPSLSQTAVCCIQDKTSISCANTNQCAGFAARCTAQTKCPDGTRCCVFADESYCVKDCPEGRAACASTKDCADAGSDAGCQTGGCPVGICGAPVAACR